MISVALDAMGGDNAPGEMVKGAIQAAKPDNLKLPWSETPIVLRGFYQRSKQPICQYRLCLLMALFLKANLQLSLLRQNPERPFLFVLDYYDIKKLTG